VVELRTFTGIPVLGSVSDTRKRTGRRFMETVALGSGALALGLVYGVLLVIERQYGLDTVVAADLGGNVFEEGGRIVVQKATDLLSWVRGIASS
jgi:hypothetical protein